MLFLVPLQQSMVEQSFIRLHTGGVFPPFYTTE